MYIKKCLTKVANTAIGFIRNFHTIDNELYYRIAINSFIMFTALIFCLQRQLQSLKFVGLIGFLCQIYIVLLIIIQFPTYKNALWSDDNPIKYVSFYLTKVIGL